MSIQINPGKSHNRRAGRPRTLLAFPAFTAGVVALVLMHAASAQNSLPVQDISGPELALSISDGLAPADGAQTVPFWTGQFTDPTTGVTYPYHMAGLADPRQFTGTTAIQADIVPINVVFSGNSGFALNGSEVIPSVLASPIFTPSDFSATAIATGGAGELSLGDDKVQYLDAVMRSEFNQTGTAYHLILSPSVFPAITLNVPAGQGGAFVNSRGIPYGLIDKDWFVAQVWNTLHSLNLDPTHLSLFISKDTRLGSLSNGHNGFLYLGVHWSGGAGFNGNGPVSGNGVQPIHSLIWAAYVTPGLQIVSPVILLPDGKPGGYFGRDIVWLTHELAEWANDPFNNNSVNPFLFPPLNMAYGGGCGPVMEVGDPVQQIGFVMPGNVFDTNQYSDGFFHLQDEVFLPWFARENPNMTSQPAQKGSTGRYTFMGNLNPYASFHQPAADCSP